MTIEVRGAGVGAVSEVQFTLPADAHDGAVSVVGSFNDWTPGVNVLEAQPDGSQSVVVMIDAGSDVHFRYLGTDGVWFDDSDADEITAQGSVIRADTLDPAGAAHQHTITEDQPSDTTATGSAEAAILESAGPGTKASVS